MSGEAPLSSLERKASALKGIPVGALRHLKESWVRIPLPKDVRLSRQLLTGGHTKLGAILAGGDMVSPGLAEARYMPDTGRRRWELFPGPLELVLQVLWSHFGGSWHRAHCE